MEHDLCKIRRVLIELIEARRTIEASTQERPSKWFPLRVTDPTTQLPFTSKTAWEFIQERLTQNCEFWETDLHQPPGAVAYEMKFKLGPTELYVKLEIVRNNVWGRSFHT
jgi:hypothetical protein